MKPWVLRPEVRVSDYVISADPTSPQEDLELKPNPVYGISTSEEICAVFVMHCAAMDWALQPEVSVIMFCSADHTPPPEHIELNPNPGYGIAVQQESQTSDRDAYDYVLN